MLITFQKFHAYNKVFFLDLNKLAFYPPFIILLHVGLFSLLQVLSGCKIEQFTEMLIICSLIDFPSGGFESFAK
jgi:hypothetical protein